MTTEQRLERLEQENRWMRWIGAVAVAVVAAVLLVGQGKDKEPQDLVVRSLRVMDGLRTRAELDVLDESPYLKLNDRTGRDRITLYADFKGDSTLFFSDRAGKTRLALGVTGDGSPFVDSTGTADVSFADKDDKMRVILGTKVDGTPSLRFFDKAGKVIWKAPGE
jgi:hypothetical protein